jgi:hypothetical protein
MRTPLSNNQVVIVEEIFQIQQFKTFNALIGCILMLLEYYMLFDWPSQYFQCLLGSLTYSFLVAKIEYSAHEISTV